MNANEVCPWMLMRKCLLAMLILMLVNLNTGYNTDTDADLWIRIMSLCWTLGTRGHGAMSGLHWGQHLLWRGISVYFVKTCCRAFCNVSVTTCLTTLVCRGMELKFDIPHAGRTLFQLAVPECLIAVLLFCLSWCVKYVYKYAVLLNNKSCFLVPHSTSRCSNLTIRTKTYITYHNIKLNEWMTDTRTYFHLLLKDSLC